MNNESTTMRPRVDTLVVGALGTCCYVLHGPEGCVIIDPGAEAKRIREACGNEHIAGILLTHGHYDHIGAVAELMDEGTVLYVHPEDEELLNDPSRNVSLMMGNEVVAPAPTGYAMEGVPLKCGGLTFHVLHTPGHTKGGVCYELGDLLFTGDTLFQHGYGRTDFYGGSEVELVHSLRKLLRMRDNHIILPGHGG